MSAPATVEVLLFAALRQRFAASQISVPYREQMTGRELKSAILDLKPSPQLEALLESCRVAVDQEMIPDGDPIAATAQEIAVIPPVSGGMGDDEEKEVSKEDSAEVLDGQRSRLSAQALDLDRVLSQVQDPNAGGIDIFIGQVRRHSRGRDVSYLEYEAYPPMAVRAMDQIALSIESDIPGTKVAIAHRRGHLEIGEAAVIIAASAPHRAEAFDACRRAIEALKKEVPIWKKEVDPQGEVWIGQGP